MSRSEFEQGERKVRNLEIDQALDEPAAMIEPSQPGSLSLLRLIVELKGSEMPTNKVFLVAVGEREPETLAAELVDLERAGLISWAAAAEQWTPTMTGLAIGLALPAYEPGQILDIDICAA